MAKKTYFTLKEMISFGYYLLSEKREKRLKDNDSSIPYDDRKREVNDADIANWKEQYVG